MGRYVWRSCRNCGYKIESGVAHYVKIGNPIMICPQCTSLIKLDHINEWELMSLGGKISHLMSSFKTALLLSVFTGFILSLALKLISQEIEITTLFIISPVIAFILTIVMVIKNIAKSKKRMEDAQYRSSIENANFKIG